MPDPTGAPPLDDEIEDEIDAPQVLLVRVGTEVVAIRLADVHAVTRAGRTVRLPGAPTWVSGLAAARGGLVPVADLAAFARGEAADRAPWCVLVERGARAAFLAVSAVDGVRPIAEEVSAVAPSTGALPGSTLPRRGAVRLQTQGAAGSGDDATADVLDVDAVFRELFEED